METQTTVLKISIANLQIQMEKLVRDLKEIDRQIAAEAIRVKQVK